MGENSKIELWASASISDQDSADEIIPDLLKTPAAVRFLSVEPMMGPVDLSRWLPPFDNCDHYDGGCTRPENVFANTGNPSERSWLLSCRPEYCVFGRRGIDWVIVCGESGPNARPVHPDWVRSIRDQCVKANIPFYFAGWGEWNETPENKGENQ